jgi:ferredoxin/flavodoxin
LDIKKIYGLYFSPTGTTQKAIKAFAAGTGIPFEEHDLTTPKARRTFNRSFGKNDLVIVGLPVYGGRLPRNLDDFFGGLKGDATPAVAVAMYGNREYDDALIELKIKLEERGFVVKAGAAFIGEHTFSKKIATGRPDSNDLRIAANFGSQVAASISTDIAGTLTLKGHFPFVMKGYDPGNPGPHPTYFAVGTNENCTQCKLCVGNCPWGAIDEDNPAIINLTKCLRCLRCIKICPASAKQIMDEKFQAYLPQFEARLNAKRCEPELFLTSSS